MSFPGLTPARVEVAEALVELCSGSDERALSVLGLTGGQVAELERDRVLWEAPALPAAELYTGVLYDALGLGGLVSGAHGSGAAERARASVVIFSGLWGALRVDDPVPPYRLAMGVKLPPLGSLAAFWRPALRAALADVSADGLLVDMRSAPYAAAWRADARARERTVAVRVLRERGARRTVVSHMAKATRGAVAGALLRAGAEPETPKDLAEAVNDLGYRAELTEADRPGAPATLNVIVAD